MSSPLKAFDEKRVTAVHSMPPAGQGMPAPFRILCYRGRKQSWLPTGKSEVDGFDRPELKDADSLQLIVARLSATLSILASLPVKSYELQRLAMDRSRAPTGN